MHCSGSAPVLRMIECAACVKIPCCTATQQQTPEPMVTSCVSSTHCAWFAEQWNISEIRDLWPALQKPAQRCIACFETLAQLALAMTAHKVIGAQQWRFALPAASDNTAAESGTDKLRSTAEPLGTFFKMAASWSARHHVELLVTHLPEKKTGQTNSAEAV